MKQKDIALIILVVFVAGVISYFVASLIFTSNADKNMTAQVVQPISTDFQKPDEQVFNDKAINPTQLIQIGNNPNSQSF